MDTTEAVTLREVPAAAYKLGTGILSWDGEERRSNRYGSISLLKSMDSGETTELLIPEGHGVLLVKVVTPQKSRHTGDLSRGIFPRTPRFGQVIVLGAGRFFAIGKARVGVKPAIARPDDWLDPHALFDCHESVVNLYWLPTNG